jgi:16S rRNA processing protein RimM
VTSNNDPLGADGWVPLGAVIRPHGIKGGLKLHLENPDSQALTPGMTVCLRTPRGKEQLVKVEGVLGGGRIIVDAIRDRTTADLWRGAQILVQRDDLPPLDDDHAYLVDFLGARVVHKDGTELGTIAAFTDNSVQPLAEVRTTTGTLALMPMVPGIVITMDEENHIVVVDPPEGLLTGESEVADFDPEQSS